MRRWLRTYLPNRGRATVTATGWQLIGGRRWSLCLLTDMTTPPPCSGKHWRHVTPEEEANDVW